MARPRPLAAPRVTPVTLPRLEDGDVDGPIDDRHDSERLSFAGRKDALLAGRTLAEVELASLHLESLTTVGARFNEVVAEGFDVVDWDSHDASWRDVQLSGGRIGSLDLSGADLSTVRLSDLRLGYLDLRGATVLDMIVENCRIGTLDLPSSRLGRVAFRDTRVAELDIRAAECTDVDIRGLDVTDRLEIAGRGDRPPLAGITASAAQLGMLAPVLARQAGLALLD